MKKTLLVVLLSLLGGCVQYTLVPAGQQLVGNYAFSVGQSWNRVPSSNWLPKGTELWTVDGVALNSLMIWPALADGDTLFKSNKKNPYATYRSDMLPTDVQTWVEASLTKSLGEGAAIVQSSNLKPVSISGKTAFQFDLGYETQRNIRYEGKVLVIPAAEGGIGIVLYRAVGIHYYEQLLPEYESLVSTIAI